jgi:hypothetical protein
MGLLPVKPAEVLLSYTGSDNWSAGLSRHSSVSLRDIADPKKRGLRQPIWLSVETV